MKKIFTSMLLLVAVATTAMAQTAVTDLGQLSNDKVYVIQSERCWLGYISAQSTSKLCTTNANNWSGTPSMNDEKFHFNIISENNAYYLYSVGAGKYVNKSGDFTDDKSDALELTDQGGDYKWLLTIGGNGLNTQIRGQFAEGIVVNTWATPDAGNKFKILDATVEVPEPDPVTSLDAFESNKAYTITCDRGTWVVVDGTFKTNSDASVSADATNANQQFTVLTLDNEDYYLYSVGGNGFVNLDGTIAAAGDPIQLNDASSHAANRVQIQFKGTSTYVNMGGSSNTCLDGWSTIDAGNAVKFLEVAEFAGAEDALKMLASGLLAEAVVEYDAKSALLGEGLGKFSCTLEGYETEVAEIKAYSQSIPDTATVEEIYAKVTRLGEIVDAFVLNMPKAGSYIRVAYDYGGTTGTLYMQGEISENTANKPGVKFTSDKGAASIWYYDGTSLISYTKGVCIAETGDTRGLQDVGVTQQVTFNACDRAEGKYFVKLPDFIHANTAGSEHFTDHCPNDNNRCAQHCLILEDVTELPVSITSAGYATLYAPVALTVPAGVTAHTVTINGEWATLSEPLATIPANTGVVLAGDANTYNFTITTADAFEGANALAGTVAATYVTEDAYVLGYINVAEEGQPEQMEVGFGTATKNQAENTAWKNNSHKAYLPVAEGAALSTSLRFDFGGTTGIEQITDNREQSTEIYDLQGRRVSEITEKGIYIVGGKKVLVK